MFRAMWWSLVLVLFYHPCINGKEGILKEGTMKDWFLRAFQVEGNGQFWTTPGDKNYSQTFTISDDTDFWLITNYADIKNETTIIYVDIEYKIDLCENNFPCNLTVYVHKGKDLAFPEKKNLIKTYLHSNFYLVHVIKAVEGNKTKARFKLSFSGQYITFGISAKAVDATVYGIKMFYYYCEETFIDNIFFPNTTSSASQSKAVNGNCSENSISPLSNGTEFEALCLQNGTWTRRNGSECLCVEGFEPRLPQGCEPCMEDHFKSAPSNDLCTKCPEGNQNNDNKTTCKCKKGKYRELPTGRTDTRCFGLPSQVRHLTVENITKSSVILKWDEPSDNEGFNKILKYDVECYSCNSSKSTGCEEKYEHAQYHPAQYNLTTTSVSISGLKPGSKYKFKVYSKNMVSKPAGVSWEFEELSADTLEEGSAETSKKKKTPLVYIIAGVGAIVLLLILVIVIVILVLRSRRKSLQSRSDSSGYEGLVLPTLGQRAFVDPTNYEDPEAAVRDFANEIDAKALSLERVLGGGEFGDVYKGTLTNSDGQIVVAAKTLKHDSDIKSRKDFFMEASAMGQFDDPNVIRLEGVITKTKPHMIITEYMANGSLDNFLKQNEELTDLQMIGMARGVASGMKYLAAINFIHRDLAARNVLVNETLVCKVADFGLSRELETDESSTGEYCTSGGKIPVRWTAPEAIKYRKFSTASDVWSYGILLWEIMSFAERPYWEWNNYKVMERVEEGFRLPLPMKCPKAVYELMLKCWEKERNQRPQFPDIVVMMNEWIRSPETIRDSVLLYRNSGSTATLKEPSTPIKEWLDTIKLSAYMPYFTNAGHKELSDLAGFLDNDLKDLGITLIGHRNKMLRTIRSLPITGEVPKIKREKSLQV